MESAEDDSAVHMSESLEMEGMPVEQGPAKFFSVVQTKKFWAPLLAPTCRLCPSMDLVVLGMQTPSAEPASAASLWLHRTVSWQRLSTLTNFDGEDDTEDLGVTHFAWSPDGRKFALALPNGNVVLYQVEAMVSSIPSMDGGDSSSNGLLCAVPVGKEGFLGLTWATGRSHPSWKWTDAEQEEEVSWR
jgi:Anaphase-promoting complex subunit 4 WD40 domain